MLNKQTTAMLNNKPGLCSRNGFLGVSRMPALSISRRGLLRCSVIGAVLVGLLFTGIGRAGDWGEWRAMEDHPGVDFRVRAVFDNPTSDGRYTWTVQFRNRYDQVVSFNFKVTHPDEQPGFYSRRAKMNPGEIDDGGAFGVAVPPDGEVMVWTDDWEFGR